MSSKDGSTNALEIYQFKIALKYNRPQIWRRIQVPEYFSFFDLHVAIEDLFKIKSSSHLHKFEMVQSRRFFIPFNGNFQLDEYIGIPIEALADYCNILPEKETKIGEQFSIIRSKCLYTYGFNSERKYDITLEQVSVALLDVNYPICIKGAKQPIPEDYPEQGTERVERPFSKSSIVFRDPEVVWRTIALRNF